MKSYVTSGTGAQQTLTGSQDEKVAVYQTLADAEADLANLEAGQIVATPDTGDENAQPVDVIQAGNMHAVTSNAVADDLGQQYNDSSAVDISSRVTMSLGVTSVRARRFNNMVYISFSGDYTGQPSNATQVLISGLPQKYRPSFEVVGLCALGYSSNYSSVGRVILATDGTIYLQETEWLNNTAIRAGIIYFI